MKPLKFIFSIIFLYVVMVFVLNAQPTSPIAGTDIRPVALSGSIGFLTEGYTISGIDARRPPGMGQINAATSFSIFGFRSGINLLYSTDDNQFRQSMNRFNFQGSWRWLTVSAGTVSPRFSKYSLGGVTVTGGLIEISPPGFSLSVTAGRTKRSVEFTEQPGFREPAYEQWLYAARLGFGRRGRNEFALTGVYAFDRIGSITEPGSVLPAENLNITPQFTVFLFKGNVVVESNLTVSAFTRDRQSDELDMDDVSVPSFLTNIFTPRSSTRVDFAGEVSGRIAFGPLRLDGGYERVQPGFQSLGLGQVRSDQESYRFRPQVRLLNGRANISGTFSQGRNNLLDTRISTMRRQQLGSNITMRLTQTTNLTLSYMRMTNVNKPVDETAPTAAELHQKQISQNFMLTPSFVFRSGMTSHSVSVTGSYQMLDDKSEMVVTGVRPAIDFTNLSTGLSYGISLPDGLSFNVSGNYLRNESDVTTATGHSFNAGSGYAFFDRLLTVNLTLGWSRNGTEFVRVIEDEDPLSPLQRRGTEYRPADNGNDFLAGEYIVRQWSQQYTVNFAASYRLPNGNPIRFTVRSLSSRPGDKGGREYDEVRASLRYDHRF